PGQYYASPALAALLKTTPASELGDRYPGRLAGTIGGAALPSPGSLVIIAGDTAAQLARAPGAVRATSISATPPRASPWSAWPLHFVICAVSSGVSSASQLIACSVACSAHQGRSSSS